MDEEETALQMHRVHSDQRQHLENMHGVLPEIVFPSRNEYYTCNKTAKYCANHTPASNIQDEGCRPGMLLQSPGRPRGASPSLWACSARRLQRRRIQHHFHSMHTCQRRHLEKRIP